MNATKNATVKTVKPATVKTVKPVIVQNQVNVVYTALLSRLASCEKYDLKNQVTAMQSTIKRTSSQMLDLAQSKLSQSDFAAIATRISTVNAHGVGLDQVKSIDKIVRFMGAIALDQAAQLCNYLKQSSITTLNNDGSVSVTELICALSRAAYRANYGSFSVREGFENLASYSIGTGASQASQARQVFSVFGFYDGFVKGAKNNKPKLTVYGETMLRGLVFKKVA